MRNIRRSKNDFSTKYQDGLDAHLHGFNDDGQSWCLEDDVGIGASRVRRVRRADPHIRLAQHHGVVQTVARHTHGAAKILFSQ